MSLKRYILFENFIEDVKIDVPHDIRQIHKLFKQYGKKLYLVGGSVRDAVLGKEPKDFDLATDATPDEVLKIAQSHGLHTTEVGKAFGVVVVSGHEIATFREDIGTDRKNTKVNFTTIEGDVKRRDLTINSLFYDLDNDKIVDLVGGIDDLKSGTIRTVGNPIDRFEEDRLRKLRALRFYGQMGNKIDTETLQALKYDNSLRGVSKERVRDEFIKSIQKAKSVIKYLKMTEDIGFLDQILENVHYDISKAYETNDYILLISSIIEETDGKELEKLLELLKYSREEKFNIRFLVELKNFDPLRVFEYKQLQKKSSLSDEQIVNFMRNNGIKEEKFVRFNLSIGGEEPIKMGLQGEQIKHFIHKKESELYKKFK
jgi:tRNA nucleotidyltransferase/poly(A) polymerase